MLAKKRTEGLSKNSVRIIRATLSVMLSDAVDDGILMVNPVLGINRKGRKSPDSISQADRKKSIKAMTHEQLATLLTFSSARCSRRNHVLHLLLADAGLRPGEACATMWSDYDAAAKTLRIERAVTNTGRIEETKTGDSREVDLSPRLAAALDDLRAQLEADALADGRSDISSWVFATRVGKPPRPHRAAKTFHKVLVASGLPHFRLYDLRHTYASHLIAERERRHRLRGQAARPRKDDDDAALLRPLVPEGRPALRRTDGERQGCGCAAEGARAPRPSWRCARRRRRSTEPRSMAPLWHHTRVGRPG